MLCFATGRNPNATMMRCQQSVVDPKMLLKINAFSLARVTEMEPDFLENGEHEHEHDPTVTSVAFKFDGFLNMHHLSSFISEIIQTMGADLFRYKGVLNVAGMEEKFVFQGVGMLFR